MKSIVTRVSVLGTVATCALLIGRPVLAQDAILELAIALGGGEPVESEVTVSFEEETEIEVNDQFRLVVVPTLAAEDRIRLAFRLYEVGAQSDEPLAALAVVTVYGVQARIEQGTEPASTQNLSIRVTPRVQ